MVKKYIILFGGTFLALLGLLFISKSAEEPPKVEVQQLEYQTAQTVVNCSGRVEEAQKREIYTDLPIVAKNIYVSEGDWVEKDEILFEVDKNSTVEAIAASGMLDSENVQAVLSLLQEHSSILSDKNSVGDSFLGVSGLVSSIPDKITAPISGRVKQIGVISGELSDSSVPVAAIVENDKLQVRLSVNESQISEIQVGQKAIVTGAGFKGSSYQGEISSISSYATQEFSTTATETIVDVILKMGEYGSDFKAGFTANAKVIIEEKENTIIVPYESVGSDDEMEEFVYLSVNDTVVKREIQTGKELENGFEVLSGLEKGELLILSPDEVREGQTIEAYLPSQEKTGRGEKA